MSAAVAPNGDAATAARLRVKMGEELRRRRREAKLSQTDFGQQAGYSQAVVAHAEKGRDDVGAAFWQAADRVLGTGNLFASRHEEVLDCLEPGRRAAVRADSATPEMRCGAALRSAKPDQAAESYKKMGWPAEASGDMVELLTGQKADALEIGRTAGMVAAGAWLESGGAEGAVRGLPRLPAPTESLAVIEAGERWFFLVKTGFPVPWGDTGLEPAAGAGEAEIGWHSAGGRVPLPPSKTGPAAARWAYLPGALLRPAPPLAVLGLLDWAAAVTRAPGRLRLPGGTAAAAPPPRP